MISSFRASQKVLPQLCKTRSIGRWVTFNLYRFIILPEKANPRWGWGTVNNRPGETCTITLLDRVIKFSVSLSDCLVIRPFVSCHPCVKWCGTRGIEDKAGTSFISAVMTWYHDALKDASTFDESNILKKGNTSNSYTLSKCFTVKSDFFFGNFCGLLFHI